MCPRPIMCEYGMWDQLRVDHGREWYLILFVQEHLAHLRRNTTWPPHLQTSSKQVLYVLFIFYMCVLIILDFKYSAVQYVKDHDGLGFLAQKCHPNQFNIYFVTVWQYWSRITKLKNVFRLILGSFNKIMWKFSIVYNLTRKLVQA